MNKENLKFENLVQGKKQFGALGEDAVWFLNMISSSSSGDTQRISSMTSAKGIFIAYCNVPSSPEVVFIQEWKF